MPFLNLCGTCNDLMQSVLWMSKDTEAINCVSSEYIFIR